MTLLTPTYEVTVGSKRWTTQLVGLTTHHRIAPGVGSASLRLPAEAPLDAEPGDRVEVVLSNDNHDETVFVGLVLEVEQTLEETFVNAVDASGTLAVFRPAITFEQVATATVVGSLCGEVGVEVSTLEPGVQLPFYVAGPERSGLEHIARVCAWSGAFSTVTAEGKVTTAVVDASQPELALRFGRELHAMRSVAKQFHSPTVIVAGEAGAGSPASPEAHRVTTDFFAGHRPSGPDADTIWMFEAALRSAQAAQTASGSWTRRLAARETRVEAFLLPHVRPLQILEIQDLPDEIASGPFWVSEVSHRLGSDGARSTLTLFSDRDGFDLMSLLGSLADLAGPLL